VASRTSSFAFKDSTRSISDIAGELKVGHVLEGSVRKSQNRLRITAQLIDAASDRHLWSETFDRELDDIFVIQDEIASAIVSALEQELGLQTSSVIEVKADTANLDAYELYLKARGLFLARKDLRQSIELYEQAVAMDPNFARAWEGLAAVYSVAPSWGITDQPYAEMTVPAADRALALNPGLSMPYAVKADGIWRLQGQPTEAEALFARALENDPANATAHLWRGIFYSALGEFDAAEADFKKCLEIDPQYGNCHQHYALHLVIMGQAQQGLQMLDQVVVAGFFGNSNLFTPTRIREGQLATATMAVWLSLESNQGFPMQPVIAAVLYPERDHSDALAQVKQWLAANGFQPQHLVFLMSILGEHQHLADTSTGWPLGMLWLPEHRSFRESLYFKPLIQKHGFPGYWRTNGFPPMCRPLGDEDFQCD
jgi:Tfp pilus assembly protein PilF